MILCDLSDSPALSRRTAPRLRDLLPSRSWKVVQSNPVKSARAIVSGYGQNLSALHATLPLLGQLQPLVRKLFVAPLAFLVPTVGEILVFARARSFRLVPGRTAARCAEVYRHGDLHLPLSILKTSAIVALAP